MSRFNTKRPVTRIKTTNLAGGKAFKLNKETELVHAVLTTFLDDKFYESGNERIKRIERLVADVDPEFVAKLAVFARKEFHLRSVSHLLLGLLAVNHSGDDLVKRAVVAGTERPDDLLEFASFVLANTDNKALTKQAKRGIRNALLKFGRHQLAKYRAEGKELSLVDLFNLVHPRIDLATFHQRSAWQDLMTGNLKSEGTWETEISNAEDSEARAEAWESLVLEGKLGYMALIRNLNNLIKNDVSPKVVKAAVAQLTDPDRIAKSKQLPFRFWTAYNTVAGNRLFTDAISEAMDIAVSNAPKLKGKTLIAVDASGSMAGDPIVKASIFASTLMKANKDADVILYDTEYREFEGSSRIPVVDLANAIIRNALGGGTNTSKVFEYASDQGGGYDRIIILSDNESWQDSYMGSTQESYKAYCKEFGEDPYVYAIDIQGYGTKDVTGGRVFHLAGFSDRVLDFIGMVEKGETLTETIKSYELD